MIKEHADYCRRILDHYGFTETEHHLNEWNLWTDRFHRDSIVASSKTLGFMLMMQDTSTNVMCFYDSGLGFSDYRSLINPDTGHPYRTYYAFMMFNSLYQLGHQVQTQCSNDKVFVNAAVDGRKACLVIANTNDVPVEIDLDVRNFPKEEVQVLRVDEENRYTLTGEDLAGSKITVPANGCVEVKLWDLV